MPTVREQGRGIAFRGYEAPGSNPGARVPNLGPVVPNPERPVASPGTVLKLGPHNAGAGRLAPCVRVMFRMSERRG